MAMAALPALGAAAGGTSTMASFLPALAGVGSSLMGGGGAGSLAGGAGADMLNPWSAAITGQETTPPMPEKKGALPGMGLASMISRGGPGGFLGMMTGAGEPGMPEMNPLFKGDRDLYGGEQNPPALPVKRPENDMPMPTQNPLFSPSDAERGMMNQGMQQPTARPLMPQDMAAPGSDVTKSIFGNEELGNQAGFTTETHMGRDVTGMSNDEFQRVMAAERGADTQPPIPTGKGAGVLPDVLEDDTSPQVLPSVFRDTEPTDPLPTAAASRAGNKATEAQSLPDNGLFSGLSGGVESIQQRLRDAPTNPLFRAGMGLMASGYDGSNPYANIMGGLDSVESIKRAQAELAIKEAQEGRSAETAAQQKMLSDALRELGGKVTGGEDEDRRAASRAPQASVIRR